MDKKITLNKEEICHDLNIKFKIILKSSSEDIKKFEIELSSATDSSVHLIRCFFGDSNLYTVVDQSHSLSQNINKGKNYFEINRVTIKKNILVELSCRMPLKLRFERVYPDQTAQKSLIYELDCNTPNPSFLVHQKVSSSPAMTKPAHSSYVSKATPFKPIAPITLNSLEKCFGNLLHEIYMILQGLKKLHSQFEPVGLAREMGYLNNLYRYILFARSQNFENAENQHEMLFSYLEKGIWQESSIPAKIQEALLKYKRDWNAFWRNQESSISDKERRLTVLPMLETKSKIGKYAHFYQMIKRLYETILEIEQKTPILGFPALEEIQENLEKFKNRLEKLISFNSRFKIEDVHPHVWLSECLKYLNILTQESLSCFILFPKGFLDDLWSIVFLNYPGLKKMAVSQKTEQFYWNFTGDISFAEIFYRKRELANETEIAFCIEENFWNPIPLPPDLAFSLQKLCNIYKEDTTRYAVLYKNILEHFTPSHPSLESVRQKISSSEKEICLKELMNYYEGKIEAEMKPLLDWLQIQILLPDPADPACEKKYEFRDFEEKEPGYQIENRMVKTPCYTYAVTKPSCWEILQDFQNFLQNSFAWQEAGFWYEGKKNPQKLFSEIQNIIRSIDQKIYRNESKSPEYIQKYEELLWNFQNALHSDGYDISFAAGTWEQARQKFPEIRYELPSLAQKGFMTPGYPMILEARPFSFPGALPLACQIVYCRGFRPYMLDFLEKKQNAFSFMPEISQAIFSLIQSLYKEWPENKESFALHILEKLVKPLHSYSQRNPQEIYGFLEDLHNSMKKDGLKGLYPHPGILYKKAQRKENGAYWIEEEYTCFQEVFSDLPYLTVAEINDFILEGDRPVQSLFKISVGNRPWGLDLFHGILCHLNDWVKEWEARRSNANLPLSWISNSQSIPSSYDFREYARDIVTERQIQDEYYPKFLGCSLDLAQFHRQFFQSSQESASLSSPLLQNFFSLIQLLDSIVSLWYSDVSHPDNAMESLRKSLAKDEIELIEKIHLYSSKEKFVFPVRIEDNIQNFIPLCYLCSQEGTLAIRQRRFLKISESKDFVYPTEYNEKVVLIQGIRGNIPEAITKALQDFFLNTWCLLQQESNNLNRQNYLEIWERAYYNFHSSGSYQGTLDIFNAFYKISEGIEKALGNYQKFCDWESRLNFLENYLKQNHGISKVFVRRGDNPETKEEIKQNFQLQESPIKSQGMQYKQGGIIRVLKPAFIRMDKTRIQVGEVLLQA